MFNIFNLFKKKEKKEKKTIQKKSLNLNEFNLNDPVDRNLAGKKLEKNGFIDDAIKLYEININEKFEGNHPYDRLAIIYRRKKLYDDEKRVLQKAIKVFEENVYKERADRIPKLEKFKDRLEKLNQIIKRQQ